MNEPLLFPLSIIGQLIPWETWDKIYRLSPQRFSSAYLGIYKSHGDEYPRRPQLSFPDASKIDTSLAAFFLAKTTLSLRNL